MQTEPVISLALPADQPGLTPAFWGEGARLRVLAGRTLRQVLIEQIGLDPDYLENRVQTLFVNGCAVDDFDQVIVENNTVIALSAAMPGLAGATLRRGGCLSVMRRQISQPRQTAGQRPSATSGDDLIRLKLFNVIAREIGPQLLAKGILLTGRELDALLEQLAPVLAPGSLTRDGMTVGLEELRAAASSAPSDYLCLKITSPAHNHTSSRAGT